MIRLVLATLLLAGCSAHGGAKPEPIIVTKEIAVPTPVPCVPSSVGPAPSYPDTDEALRSAGPDRSLQLILAGRDLRIKRSNVVEPVIASPLCRKADARD